MINLQGFTSNVQDRRFLFFDINEEKYSLPELLNGLSKFTSFMQKWNVSADWIISTIEKDPQIKVNDLFDYTTVRTPFLTAEQGVYTEKWVNEDGRYYNKKTIYDVYVTSAQYVDLSLNILARHAMRFHFPTLFEGIMLFDGVRKYSPKVHDIKMTTLVADLEKITWDLGYPKLTVADLVQMMTGQVDKDVLTQKPRLKVYQDGNMFMSLAPTLEEENNAPSLYLNPSDFFNGDWDAVRNRKVVSIPYGETPADTQKWYDGKQVGAPYFDEENPIINAVKDIIINARKEN